MIKDLTMNNNDANIINYYIKGISRIWAPRIINIAPLKIRFNLPKLIRVRTVFYMDYKGADTEETFIEAYMRDKKYPIWFALEVHPEDTPCVVLRKALVPEDKVDDVENMIKNIPSRIEAYYGKDEKDAYISYAKRKFEPGLPRN